MDENTKRVREGRDKLTRNELKNTRGSVEGKKLPTYLDKRKEDQDREDKLEEKNRKTRKKNIKKDMKGKRERESGDTVRDEKEERKYERPDTKYTDAKKKAEDYGLLGGKNGRGADNDKDTKGKGNYSNGRKRPNVFSYKSVKEDIIEGGIDEGAKKALNKYAWGAGTALEKLNRKLTGKDKVHYTKKMNFQGKIMIALLAVVVVVLAWFVAFLAFFILLFGAAALLMSDDDGSVSSGGESVGDKNASESGFVSGKGKQLPPELAGKFIVPNTERVVSLMGWRTHPITKKKKLHEGLDIAHRQAGKTGWAIYPIAPGKVYEVLDKYPQNDGTGWGNLVRVDHGGYTSLYAHLTPGIPVKVGDEVGIDTVIAIMGNTGSSTNYHLHLEIYEGDKTTHYSAKHRIDPMAILSCTETKSMPQGIGMKTECYNYQKKVRGI